MDEKMKININQIFGIDPLMKFYKEEIGILKENSYLNLIESPGENIPIDNKKILISSFQQMF